MSKYSIDNLKDLLINAFLIEQFINNKMIHGNTDSLLTSPFKN